MVLAPHEVLRFFQLLKPLLWYVKEREQLLCSITTYEDFIDLGFSEVVEVRDFLWSHTEVVDEYCERNPNRLPAEDLADVRAWKGRLSGKFMLMKQLRSHALFLSTQAPATVYGVTAIVEPFSEVMPGRLPIMVDAVLLPFAGRVIYDGILKSYPFSFGGGARGIFENSLRQAKARSGVVTTDPRRAAKSETGRAKRPSAKLASGRRGPSKGDTDGGGDKIARIDSLIEDFCRRHLNEDYLVLCRKLAGKLAGMRPSPLLSGKAEAWAAGVVRTIGWANFLSDPSQRPHMLLRDVDRGFGIGESTGAARTSRILELVPIRQLDHHWMLPSRISESSISWIVTVNGLATDVRTMPREVQEIAYKKGLIPWIPADRE